MNSFKRENFEIAPPGQEPLHLKPAGTYTTLNCFWPNNKKEPKRTCVSSHHLKNQVDEAIHYIPKYDETPDRILNFTFNFATGASINNRRFEYGEPMHQGRMKNIRTVEKICFFSTLN